MKNYVRSLWENKNLDKVCFLFTMLRGSLNTYKKPTLSACSKASSSRFSIQFLPKSTGKIHIIHTTFIFSYTKKMKLQFLFLFALFAISATQAAGYGYSEHFADNCEDLFNTTNCNKCQSLLWDHFEHPGQCATAFNLGHEVFEVIEHSGKHPKPYDLTFFKKGLKNYCHKGFHCSQHEAEKIYNKIQHVCKHELSVKLDWSDDPREYDDLTSYIAYGTLLIYYNGIPARKALCDIRDHHGGKLSSSLNPFFCIQYFNATSIRSL